ncbi:MAG: tetratricopeptide repeat protein [Thermoanaerobaculia bacterium]|nr:tetratricopeptide repeat protein [Thermoanaerobaculia bacterium]
MRRVVAAVLLLISVALVAFVLMRRSSPAGPVGEWSVERGKRPVVLITVDTSRADRFEPYGAENVATPVLQRLADRAVVFENAIAVAPITLVAHTTILTGTYPFEHGVRNNGIQYVPDEMTTLAERLRDHGYRTGAFVSAAVLESRYGLDQGFEVYDDDLSAGRNRSPRQVPDRPAEATIESVFSWLDTLEENEKYFLWVHFYDPHAPYSPPAPFRDDYRERLYDGEIAYLDSQIGTLLRHPRLRGVGDDEPIVTVIGDHGESLGEHGEQTHAILAYDSTLRIPWILRVPGMDSARRVQQNVGQVDWMPTMLSILGLSADGMEGRDLVPVIEGAADAASSQHAYYSETYLPFYTYGWSKLRAFRRGGWKFIDAPTPELYDLSGDPRELSNVHEGQPGVAHDLARDLRERLEAAGGGDRETSLELDSESVEKLRSLGYLATGSTAGRGSDERLDPKEVIDLHVGLERARMLLRDQLFDQAEEQLSRVLRRDPKNLAALVDLATALEGKGESEAALEVLDRALSIDPDYDRLYLLLARLEANLGRLDKALELVQLAVDKDPNNPDALVQMSAILSRLGRSQDVVTVLESALQTFPEHPRLNLTRARLIEMPAGNLEEAEARVGRALGRDPFLTEGWVLLGQILEGQKRLDEAVDSYRQGLERRVDAAELHSPLGLLLARRGLRQEAEPHLREAIRLTRRFRPDLHVALGALLAESGRVEEAQQEYAKVLEVQPNHPRARNNQAIALFHSGRTDEAEEILTQLVTDAPGMADVHNNLAAIAVQKEQWQKVEIHGKRALEINPELVQAWNNLAVALEELGRREESRDAYARAIALDPDYWQARFNLGVLLARSGEAERAAETFTEVLNQVPSLAEAHFQLGELYEGPLADPERAATHFNAFLRYAPDDPRSSAVKSRIGRSNPAS